MSTRVRDLLATAGVSWSTCRPRGSAQVDLAGFVPLPTSEDAASDRVLTVVAAGPDTDFHGTLDRALADADATVDGAWVLWLLGWEAAELERESLAEEWTAHGHGVQYVVATPYLRLPFAALTRRDASGADLAHADRLLAHAVAERLADEVASLRAAADAAASDAAPAQQLERLRRERAELAAELRQAESRARGAERALARLEASTSLKVGQALVGAARNPKSGLRLPRDAYRMWRVRGGRAGAARSAATVAGGTAEVAVDESARLIAGLGGGLAPRTRPVVVGIVAPHHEAALGRSTDLTTVTPDDAAVIVERCRPDVVIVDSAVSAASTSWAYLGDPAASERERRLLRTIDVAHSTGRPVVLWRSTPGHLTASLAHIAERCDLVVDSAPARRGGVNWSAGVDLREAMEPVAARSGAVFVGGADPRRSPQHQRHLHRALSAAGDALSIRPLVDGPAAEGFDAALSRAIAEPIHRRERAAAYRAAAVVIADPFVSPAGRWGASDDVLLALAVGARLVVGSDRDLEAADFGDALVLAGDDPSGAVERALERGPLTAEEHLRVLELIAARWSTDARTRELGRLLDRPLTATDPRGIAVVLAESTDSASTARFVDEVLTQEHRPLEVVVPVGGAAAPLAELSAAGVRVVPIAAGTDPGRLAQAAGTQWVVQWSAEHAWQPGLLQRLLLGAEVSGADAVVGVPGVVGPRPVSPDATGPVLVRRDAVAGRPGPVLDAHRWPHGAGAAAEIGTGVAR